MSGQVPAPEQALESLADQLRDAATVVSELIADPAEPPVLGLLAAAGPRASESPAEYATVVESVREGYLLHYGEPRIVRGADPELKLLAGDYLYALGLERLAALGDQEAIAELADLISLSAQLHADGEIEQESTRELWLAAVLAIGVGPSASYEAAKQGLRAGDRNASETIHRAAVEMASEAGLNSSLGEAADSIHFPG